MSNALLSSRLSTRANGARRPSSFTSSIVKIVYGFDVQDSDDEYVAQMVKVLEGVEALTPGRYLVEFLPFLRLVPSWFPGAGFQKKFAVYRNVSRNVRAALLARTKAGMVGRCLPSSW